MDHYLLQELIKLSLQNDRNAFRKIVEGHQSMLFSLAFRMLGNEEDAKDIVQEIFIRIWTNLSKYKPEQKFTTWIYSIATNLCLDKLKSDKRKLRLNDQEDALKLLLSNDDGERTLLNNELGAIIEALTNELSPKQRMVFTLRYLEDIEMDEMVKITGLSAEKIKSNLYLARQSIGRKLKNY